MGAARRAAKRTSTCPHTDLGDWLLDYGISRIVEALDSDPDLRVTRHAVYHWIAGRRLPHPSRALALVRLSHGRLTLDDIYRRGREAGRATQTLANAGGTREEVRL